MRAAGRQSTLVASAFAMVLLIGNPARADIKGIRGRQVGNVKQFGLTVKPAHIVTPDGGSLLIWGFTDDDNSNKGSAQLPGPTLIVNVGDVVRVTLKNQLPAGSPNVSLVFPGQTGVQATPAVPHAGVQGVLTLESRPPGTVDPAMVPPTPVPTGDPVVYTFTADHAGTFLYNSGTSPSLEIEMGLYGALIVRPKDHPELAYDDPQTSFDRETLFLLSEIDPAIHNQVEAGQLASVDMTKWRPFYWLLNGRAAPDTLTEPFLPNLPSQPYNCVPRVHPGDQLLMRMVNAGRDYHPYHHHANHARVVGRQGQLLQSVPLAGPDLSFLVFTMPIAPGETMDGIFSWTGEGLGWDIYGHDKGDPLAPFECVNGLKDPLCDHAKPIPTALPDELAIKYGEFHSGSPYLGRTGSRIPFQWKNNTGGMYYMWHSHTEREIVNDNIFPGGMMTMLIIEAAEVPIE
jgi:FtsP/CotA-like multicopper oxidase with cupredoxin domain